MASFSYLNMFKVWLFKSIKPWCYPVAINICNKSSMYVYVCYFFSFHFAITNLKLSASQVLHLWQFMWFLTGIFQFLRDLFGSYFGPIQFRIPDHWFVLNSICSKINQTNWDALRMQKCIPTWVILEFLSFCRSN